MENKVKNLAKFLILIMLFFCFFVCGCKNGNEKFFSVTESEKIERLSTENSEQLAKIVSPAIVGIESAKGTTASIGSGVSVKSGGYVLTNYHVVSNNGKITLYLHDGKTCEAIIIYSNPDLDLAVLKANYEIPYLTINDEDVFVGQVIFAVGTPVALQFKHTFTKGIVSATNRKINIELVNSNVNVMENLIQHDASINSGNSGGPLLNVYGEVVGINTLKITNAEGMGFAIGAKVFKNIISNL